MKSWPQERSWGHIFTVVGAIGFILLICSDGSDMVRAHQENSLSTIITLAVSSFGFVGLGWLVNHWPRQRRVIHKEFPSGWSEELEP